MKNKIEINQDAIKDFLNKHWEKLAFGVGVVSVGLLAYFGMNAVSYDKSDPDKMDAMVTNAENYISRSNFDMIKDHRVADKSAPARIAASEKNPIDGTKYAYGPWRGTAIRSQTLRQDPSLLAPIELQSKWVVSNFVYKKSNTGLDALPIRGKSEKTGDSKGKDEKDDKGIGGVGGIDVDEDGGAPDSGDGGNQLTGGSSDLPKSLAVEVKGVIPSAENLSIDKNSPLQLNTIVCTALVPIKKQSELYAEIFENSVGYNPLRDKPRYTYFEVLMRENYKGPAGAEDSGEGWVDVSELVNKKIEETLIKNGPEVVESKHLNDVLTRPIPPFLLEDYRHYVNHPRLKNHVWYEAPDISEDGKDADDSSDRGIFDSGDSSDDKSKSAEDKKKDEVDYLLLRFFYPQAKAGSTYQFKVRVWMLDPNNPKIKDFMDSEAKSSGTGGNGRGIAGSSGGSQGFSGSTGEGGGGNGGAGNRNNKNNNRNLTTNTKISEFMLDPKVRNRLSEAKDKIEKEDKENSDADLSADEKQLRDRLRMSRSSEWSAPSAPLTVGNSEPAFYAGNVTSDIGRVNGLEYTDGETSGSLVVQANIKDLGVKGSAERKQVFPGDGLNLESIWTILHPIDWSIRLYYHEDEDEKRKDDEHIKGKLVKTDAVLVDIVGGRSIRNLKTRDKEYFTPGQFLIMDGDGNFTIADETRDQGRYRLAIAKTKVGDPETTRRKSSKDDDDDDKAGGLPGGISR